MKIFDISPLISERTGVFPGDTPFSRKVLMSFPQGHHLTLSSIQSTVHLGAHADAPVHYRAEGEGVHALPLEPFLGKCLLLTARTPRGERVLPEDIDLPAEIPPRVLIRTNSFPNPDQWNSDFSSFSPELLMRLHQQKVSLVGIDTPSVDPEQDKKMECHQVLAKTGMRVLEGLVFERVPDGEYTLIALPLRIEGLDASPVRAVLVQGKIS